MPPPPAFVNRPAPLVSPSKAERPVKREWTPDNRFIQRHTPQPMVPKYGQQVDPRGPRPVAVELGPPPPRQFTDRNPPPRQFSAARAVRPRFDNPNTPDRLNSALKRANFENLPILTYEDLQFNMRIRGMPVDGEKELLLQRLKVLLQLEDRNRNARGYFLTQIFERNVEGRKFEWLQKDKLEKILLEIQGVVAVINIERREEKNEIVWFVVLLTTFPVTHELIAPEPLVRRYQSIPLRVCPYKNLLALMDPPKKPMTAVNRHFTPKTECNYVAVD